MQAKDSADQRKDKMKEKIISKIPKLKQKIEDFNKVILQDKFVDIKSNIFEILKEVDHLEQTCNKFVAKKKKIQDFQKTLDMDIHAFTNVEEA